MFFYKIKKFFIFSLLFGVVFLFFFIASPFIENDLLSCHYAYAQTTPPTPTPPPEPSNSGILEKIYAVLTVNPFKWPLIGMQKALGYGIEGAAYLLDQFVDATMTRNLLDSTAVKDTWAAVRDVCNLVFILALLFSAFATIFQVQKYHIKNTILMVILMALLINFSLPIARFVVDTGNVAMYYLLDILFGSANGAQVAAHITEESRVTCALIPHFCEGAEITAEAYARSNNWSGILMSVIFLFLFFITLFTIAILFVIRLIALAVLLIFSPVGFAGMVLPSLQKHATAWWDQLFKYTFFGPIMLFMIAVAVKMMEEFNQGSYSSEESSTGFVNTILAMAPALVILWAGILTASKASIVGAGVVVGAAGGVGKWAGKKFSGYNMAGRHLKRWTSQRQAQREDRARRRVGKYQEGYDKVTGAIYGGIGKKPTSKIGKGAAILAGIGSRGIIPGLRKLASNTSRERVQQSQESYDARVNDEIKKIANVDNGMDIVNRLRRVNPKDKAKAEAHLRQAAKTGNNDDIVIEYGGEEFTAEGLYNTVAKIFGKGDKAARLARSIGMIEAGTSKNNHLQGVSSFNDKTNEFEKADDDYKAMKQYAAIFGQHPQGAWRSIKKDTVITKGPSNRLRFSDDFERVLQRMQPPSFAQAIDPKNSNGVTQLPDDVISDIARALDTGNNPKSVRQRSGEVSRTEQLINALRSSGRLQL